MTAAAASWMSAAALPEVLKRTEWHLRRGSPNIPLSPLYMFSTVSSCVSCPAVPMNLYQMLVRSVSQTPCWVWHSSFIDRLFFNCSRSVLGSTAATLASTRERPSCCAPTFAQCAGSTTFDSEWLWRAKNNLQGHSFSSFHFASISTHALLPFALRAETFSTEGARHKLTPEWIDADLELKYLSLDPKMKLQFRFSNIVSVSHYALRKIGHEILGYACFISEVENSKKTPLLFIIWGKNWSHKFKLCKIWLDS